MNHGRLCYTCCHWNVFSSLPTKWERLAHHLQNIIRDGRAVGFHNGTFIDFQCHVRVKHIQCNAFENGMQGSRDRFCNGILM